MDEEFRKIYGLLGQIKDQDLQAQLTAVIASFQRQWKEMQNGLQVSNALSDYFTEHLDTAAAKKAYDDIAGNLNHMQQLMLFSLLESAKERRHDA